MEKVKRWRIATWNLQGGLMDPIKTIMVGDDLTNNEIDFVALQEVQSKEEKIQGLGKNYIEILMPKGKGSGLGFAVARKHKAVLKGITDHNERGRRRVDCQELREGKRRRREAKRKAPSQTGKIPTKRVRWGGGEGV